MEGLAQWMAAEGTPQGAVISPLLSNIYLDPLDHVGRRGLRDGALRRRLRRPVPCATRRTSAGIVVQHWMAAAGLPLHPDKTRIVDPQQRGGFDFLGYHFERGQTAAKEEPREVQGPVREKTRRTNGHSLARHHRRTSIARCEAGLSTSNTVTGRSRTWTHGFGRACAASCVRRPRRGGVRLDHLRGHGYFFAAQGLFTLTTRPGRRESVLCEVTTQLESRMRESRLSGSEGGGTNSIVSPYPYRSAGRRASTASVRLRVLRVFYEAAAPVKLVLR